MRTAWLRYVCLCVCVNGGDGCSEDEYGLAICLGKCVVIWLRCPGSGFSVGGPLPACVSRQVSKHH